MGIDPQKYTREKLDALAREMGVDEDAIAAAETKVDVVALIEGNAPRDEYADDDAGEPEASEPVAEPKTASEPRGITFIVNGVRVDANGRAVKG